MRLFREVFLVGGFLSNSVIDAEKHCPVSELQVPENAIGWNCDKKATIDGRVPAKTKCLLQCAEGFIDVVCKWLFLIQNVKYAFNCVN